MPSDQWNQLTDLLFKQQDTNDLEKLLMILLAPEERESIGTRVDILKAPAFGETVATGHSFRARS